MLQGGKMRPIVKPEWMYIIVAVVVLVLINR